MMKQNILKFFSALKERIVTCHSADLFFFGYFPLGLISILVIAILSTSSTVGTLIYFVSAFLYKRNTFVIPCVHPLVRRRIPEHQIVIRHIKKSEIDKIITNRNIVVVNRPTNMCCRSFFDTSIEEYLSIRGANFQIIDGDSLFVSELPNPDIQIESDSSQPSTHIDNSGPSPRKILLD